MCRAVGAGVAIGVVCRSSVVAHGSIIVDIVVVIVVVVGIIDDDGVLRAFVGRITAGETEVDFVRVV
jgi:hypothetical protein